MEAELEEIIRIAEIELAKLVPNTPVEVQEVEECNISGHEGNYVVTFSYWARDNKPSPEISEVGQAGSKNIQLRGTRNSSLSADLLNPWRKRFKRVEVDPKQKKVVAIRMYEPPMGVS